MYHLIFIDKIGPLLYYQIIYYPIFMLLLLIHCNYFRLVLLWTGINKRRIY